jgi:S1-C subfamily serine protease
MVFPAQKFFFISPNGVFGASLSNVSEDLAKALQLPKGLRKGVLVNEVPEDSPAYRGGLRGADVIITADGDTVSTVGQLRDLLITRFGDHSAELQIVRQQKVKKLTLSWPE